MTLNYKRTISWNLHELTPERSSRQQNNHSLHLSSAYINTLPGTILSALHILTLFYITTILQGSVP